MMDLEVGMLNLGAGEKIPGNPLKNEET